MRSQIVKRSFVIAGQKKSISLEGAVWRSLKEIATNRDVTLVDTAHQHRFHRRSTQSIISHSPICPKFLSQAT